MPYWRRNDVVLTSPQHHGAVAVAAALAARDARAERGAQARHRLGLQRLPRVHAGKLLHRRRYTVSGRDGGGYQGVRHRCPLPGGGRLHRHGAQR